MKRNILNRIALTALLFSAFTAGAQSPTAPARNFNVFVQGGAKLVNNETEGPLACGGNLTVAGGYQISINNPGDFYVGGVRTTVVIGGKVIYQSGGLTINQNGYIKIGDCTGSTIWYTDNNAAYSPIRITPNSDYNGSPRINLQVSSNTLGVSAAVNPVCQSNVIDFASAFSQMKSSSTCIGGLADNATITNSGGTSIPHTGLPSQVKINLHTGINVLNLTGTDINQITDWSYNNSADADHVLVVNVSTPASFTWTVGNWGGSVDIAACKYIMFNFPNATNLTIAGGGVVEGTVFAPFADITKTANMANIEGQVIAQSYWQGGGENHYAVFQPTITGCSGTVSTAASFTTNNNLQCLMGNSFVFTNNSTGTAPITYLWKFGDGSTSTATNPVKTYTAQGTYNVKLVATGAGGADSVTRTVNVTETPAHGYTVNNATQEVTGNNFVFTSATPTTGNTYSWDFGDGTTSTDANPSKTYAATGYYLVGQTVTRTGGCSYYSCQYVTVASDGVGGGGGGGLESESLGDLVSKREYNKIKNGISNKPDYTILPVFSKHAAGLAAKNTAGASRLQQFTPANLDASTTPQISTPADITTITKAVDVFSVDYTQSSAAKAVVLAITTEQNPYNHTKSICDRFRGATLLGTNQISIQGYNFIQFVLKQRSGDVEYCIAFAAGKSANSANFNLQSKWLISEYTGNDSVFNFQVWSVKPEHTVKLTNDILNNLKSIMPIQQTDVNFVLPSAYMTSGKRNKGNLDVNITSTRTSGNAKIVFIERINELANTDTLQIPFYLVAGSENHFSLPVKDGYEYEGHFYLDDTLTDDIYMADGGWTLDVDHSLTNVITFKPNNNPDRIYADDEYPVYRSVKVNATTSDYVSVYKFITSGQEPVDLSAYHSYKFYAKGTGTMQVRLIKESVTGFNDQYENDVVLDPNGKSYTVSFDDFTSARLKTPFTANDIKAVVYTFIMGGVATDFSFFADEQSFSPTAVASVKALSSKAVSIFPNPTKGTFECKFVSEADRDMDIILTDITGNQVYKAPVHAVMGYNDISVTLPATLPHAILFVQLGNKHVTYGVTKLNIVH